MSRILIASAAVAALAACGKGEEGRNQSVQEVAKQMSAMKVEPGQWEASTEILSAKAPTLPEEAIRQMVGQKTTVSNCVTPEQAAQPSANFLAAQKDSNCTYQDFSMDGGRVSGTATCSGGKMPGKMVMKMSGTYAPQSYDITMQTNATDMPGGVTMEMSARTTGRRTGECAADAGAKS